MSDPARYPLAWPMGKPRTKNRRAGHFKSQGRPITVAGAVTRLTDQVERLGGRYALLSSNLETRMDGTMILNRGMPADPGVCLYFQLKGEPMAMACDTYTEVSQNVAAIAAHIEATRSIERYGVASAAETLQAFRALPPPVPEKPKRSWAEIFGVLESAADLETIGALYRVKARQVQDNAEALSDLNVARDEAMAAIRLRAARVQA